MVGGIASFLTACIFHRPGENSSWTLEDGATHIKLIKYLADRSPAFGCALLGYEGKFESPNSVWEKASLFDMHYVGCNAGMGRRSCIEVKVYDAWDTGQMDRQTKWLEQTPDDEGVLLLLALSAWSDRHKLGHEKVSTFLTREGVARLTNGRFRKLNAENVTNACDAAQVDADEAAVEVAMAYKKALQEQEVRTSQHPEVVRKRARNA